MHDGLATRHQLHQAREDTSSAVPGGRYMTCMAAWSSSWPPACAFVAAVFTLVGRNILRQRSGPAASARGPGREASGAPATALDLTSSPPRWLFVETFGLSVTVLTANAVCVMNPRRNCTGDAMTVKVMQWCSIYVDSTAGSCLLVGMTASMLFYQVSSSYYGSRQLVFAIIAHTMHCRKISLLESRART